MTVTWSRRCAYLLPLPQAILVRLVQALPVGDVVRAVEAWECDAGRIVRDDGRESANLESVYLQLGECGLHGECCPKFRVIDGVQWLVVDGSLDEVRRWEVRRRAGLATRLHGLAGMRSSVISLEHHKSSHYDACHPLGVQSMQWRQIGAIDRPAYCHARPRLEVDERPFPCCTAPPTSTVWLSCVDPERSPTISMEVCDQWCGYSNSCR